MSKIYIVMMIFVLSLIVGCGQENVDYIDKTDLNGSDQVSDDEGYIGLTEEEAMNLADEKGVPFRVVERDGEMMAVTMDFRPGRINASVVDGEVVSYDIEG